MIAPTGSSLHRAAACPGSCHLPQVGEPDGEYAAAGSVRHDFLFRALEFGREHALSKVPNDYREECEAIPVEKLPAGKTGWAGEVALAYDWVTDSARELHRGGGRDYSTVLTSEVPGTIDILGIDPERRHGTVVDYKGPHAELPPIAQNDQLRFYGVATARAYGLESVTIATVRIVPDRDPYYDQVELDSLALDAIAGDVRQIMERVLAADSDTLATGKHCQYCPAMRRCPAITQMMRGLVDGDVSEEFDEASEREAVSQLKAMKEALKSYEDALKAYAKSRPIDMGDGKVWGPKVLLKNEVRNSEEARKVLRERLGDHADGLGAPKYLSATAIKAAIKSHSAAAKDAGEEVPSQDAILSSLLEDLSRKHLVRTSTQKRFEAHRPPAPIGA